MNSTLKNAHDKSIVKLFETDSNDTGAAQGTLGRTSAGPSSFTAQTARNMHGLG